MAAEALVGPINPALQRAARPRIRSLGYRVLENLNMSAMISLIAVPGVRPSRLRFSVIGASCAFETRGLKTILRTRHPFRWCWRCLPCPSGHTRDLNLAAQR
jgi:hypothetical protein